MRITMRKWFRSCLVVLLLCALTSPAYATTTAVTTATSTYPYGLSTTVENMEQTQRMLRQEWDSWKSKYVKTEGSTSYVAAQGSINSEYVAYGLLFSVYFNDQVLFDRLYGYVQSHLTESGLMQWRQNLNELYPVSEGSETGSDCDIALSLIFANRVWGSEGAINYAEEAHAMLDNIRTHDFGGYEGFELMPGDNYDNPKKTADIAVGWFRTFGDFSGVDFWDSVIPSLYRLHANLANPTTGLIPDEYTMSGSGTPYAREGAEIYFGTHAIKSILWMAMTYSWYGDTEAKNALSKLLVFFNNIGPENIVNGYYLNGQPAYGGHAAAYVSAIAAMYMTGNDPQRARDFYDEAVATVGGSYLYDHTIRLLCLMYMTGNLQNLYAGGAQIPEYASLPEGAETSPTTPGSGETNTSTTNTSGTIELGIDNPIMSKNGEQKDIDTGFGTAPIIKEGRTFLPIRALIVEMGGSIEWDGSQGKVTIHWDGKTVELWIGQTTAVVNGVVKTMDAAPFISDTGRTMLPLRFVGESLGCDVAWNPDTRTVTVMYDTAAEESLPETQIISEVPTSLPAPTLTNLKVRTYDDGTPYFLAEVTVPNSVLHLDRDRPKDGWVNLEISGKYDDTEWGSTGGGGGHLDVFATEENSVLGTSHTYYLTFDLEDEGGLEEIHMVSRTYSYQVRFFYTYYYGDGAGEWTEVYSPWSAVVSAQSPSYYRKLVG